MPRKATRVSDVRDSSSSRVSITFVTEPLGQEDT